MNACYSWRGLLLAAILTTTACGKSVAQEEPLRINDALLTIIESVDVSAELAGKLREIAVTEGQMVRESQPLASLADEQATLHLEEAMMDFNVAKEEARNDIDVRFATKSLEVARSELQRLLEQNQLIRNSVSQSEIDRLALLAEKNELEVELARFKSNLAEMRADIKQSVVKQRQVTLKQHLIVAPISGMVVAVEKLNGEWVNQSDTVVELVRIDTLRVECFVDVVDASFDLVGQPITFTPAGAQGHTETFTGHVTFVSPDANPVNSKVRVWAEIANPELRLRPGLRGALVINRDGDSILK